MRHVVSKLNYWWWVVRMKVDCVSSSIIPLVDLVLGYKDIAQSPLEKNSAVIENKEKIITLPPKLFPFLDFNFCTYPWYPCLQPQHELVGDPFFLVALCHLWKNASERLSRNIDEWWFCDYSRVNIHREEVSRWSERNSLVLSALD